MFEAFSADAANANVVFAKVDIDVLSGVAQRYDVQGVPTFAFLKQGKVIKSFSGADKNKLAAHVKELQ